MVLTNRAENIQPGSTRHLQVKNYSVRLYSLYAKDGFRNITCFSHKLRTGYLLKQVRQTFHHGSRIIGDEDSHLNFSSRTNLLAIENDISVRKYIRSKQ